MYQGCGWPGALYLEEGVNVGVSRAISVAIVALCQQRRHLGRLPRRCQHLKFRMRPLMRILPVLAAAILEEAVPGSRLIHTCSRSPRSNGISNNYVSVSSTFCSSSGRMPTPCTREAKSSVSRTLQHRTKC